MFKTKTLDNILYKERHYPAGAEIIVEDKDKNKLILLGAIAGTVISEVKINVIKNPIKIEEKETPEEIIFREENMEIKEKSDKEFTWETNLRGDSGKVKKRKYNKRGDNSNETRSSRY